MSKLSSTCSILSSHNKNWRKVYNIGDWLSKVLRSTIKMVLFLYWSIKLIKYPKTEGRRLLRRRKIRLSVWFLLGVRLRLRNSLRRVSGMRLCIRPGRKLFNFWSPIASVSNQPSNKSAKIPNANKQPYSNAQPSSSLAITTNKAKTTC